MSSVAMIDGAIFRPEDARVSVYDRGFLYGDSVFEALRTYRGEPFALDEHLARLAQSAETVGIALPIALVELADEVRRAIAATGEAECYVRLMLTRGQSKKLGLAAPSGAPLRVVLAGPLELPPAEIYETGIAAASYPTQRVADVLGVAEAKLGNYLLAVMATQRASAQGAQEALIVDARGNVLEGSTSNVFAVLGGELVTPPEGGILVGITRQKVLELAHELGLPVRQVAISLAGLKQASELFITSSIREIVPVVRLDGETIGDGKPGAITRRLRAAFSERFH